MPDTGKSDKHSLPQVRCCGPESPDESFLQASPSSFGRMDTPRWVSGQVRTPVGEVPVVRTVLQSRDVIGGWKVRWGMRRMSYRVQPGLYAVGHPTEKSPVFVTANYKLSFDKLRSQLNGLDGWMLVLDTKGVNVWCAAGKGTFGTDELVNRIALVRLGEIVSHRRLILPQLGATGVSAHKVRSACGFQVFYGPVRAGDIPAYLKAGMKATPAMRRVTFTLAERIVLVPADIVGGLKYTLIVAICVLIMSGVGVDIYSPVRVIRFGFIDAALVVLAAVCGAALPATLLPWLPGRAFAVKGAVAGLLPALGLLLWHWINPDVFLNWLSLCGWLLFFPTVSSFIGMNFTGSSTYTSLSGVKKEIRIAMPVQIAAVVGSAALWIAGLFV